MDLKSIVVGYDGSADARAALDAVADLASDHTDVCVVVAFEPPSTGEIAELMAILPDEYKTGFDVLEGSRGCLRDGEMLLQQRGVAHHGRLVEDKPAAAILDVAEELSADLIVVGSRGLGRVTRFIHGSVSSRIASHARCSFLVIHSGEDQ
jgi:nucleotide-binding universal stress UspA family protein